MRPPAEILSRSPCHARVFGPLPRDFAGTSRLSRPGRPGRLLDCRQRDDPALPHPRAGGGRPVPVGTRTEVLLPERPRTTLPRPRRVNPAASGSPVQINAVTVAVLAERDSTLNRPRIQKPDFAGVPSQGGRDGGDFSLVDPDVSMAGAAVAAASAFKREPAGEPWRRFCVGRSRRSRVGRAILRSA